MDIENRRSKKFEDIKHFDEEGNEYWLARELQTALGYTEWECFYETMEMAMISCATNGEEPKYHFAGTGKMIDPKGARREADDYRLTRFACHLIVLNSDLNKVPIEQGQMYFDNCMYEQGQLL